MPRTTRTERGRLRLADLAVLAMAAGDRAPVRRQVYELVTEHPGLHLREIARRLDLEPSHAEHHLDRLVESGLLNAEHDGGYRRFFVAVETAGPVPEGAVEPQDRPWVSLLRQKRPLAIVAQLLQEGPSQLGSLAESVGVAKSTLSHHVDKLEEAGMAERFRDGNQRYLRLTDRERVVRLLLEHEPPDDLVEGFRDLWDDVGL